METAAKYGIRSRAGLSGSSVGVTITKKKMAVWRVGASSFCDLLQSRYSLVLMGIADGKADLQNRHFTAEDRISL